MLYSPAKIIYGQVSHHRDGSGGDHNQAHCEESDWAEMYTDRSRRHENPGRVEERWKEQ
jgi:hypothetical protein